LYRDDYVANGVLVATAGKRVVNAPDTLLFTELRHARGNWWAALEAQHSSRRAASYTNDLMIPGVTLWHLAGGWKWQGGPWGARQSGVQWQVRNVFDKDYIASIGASGYFPSDPNGTRTYVQAGAPRGAYLTVFAEY
jgi:iron complex outermembrane receptor protein